MDNLAGLLNNLIQNKVHKLQRGISDIIQVISVIISDQQRYKYKPKNLFIPIINILTVQTVQLIFQQNNDLDLPKYLPYAAVIDKTAHWQ